MTKLRGSRFSTEEWARRFIASRLKVSIAGNNKDQQWHDIVRRLVNTLDHYDAILKSLA